jgi:hypothetical protein
MQRYETCTMTPVNLVKTSQVKVSLRPTVSRSVSLGVKPHLGPKTRFLLLSDSYGFVNMGHPLWREDGNFLCIIYKHSVHTSQEIHYVSATKPNRLMLFRETVAVYCENHMKHTNTLCGQNVEF